MDLLPSSEQDEIVASVARLLDSECPISRVRELNGSTDVIDSDLLAMCGRLGWFTLGLTPERGGVGYGLAEEALLFRELGRHLTPGPFLAMALGARVAAFGGLGELAAEIGAGRTTVGLAIMAGDGVTDVGAAVDATVMCLDGSGVDLVLVSTPRWSALFDRRSMTAGEETQCIDPGMRLSTMKLGDTVALVTVEESAAHVHLHGVVLTAAVLTGVAEAARDLSTHHARARIQFGRPIGVHQAVKHACSDMAVRAEAAAFQTFFAAMTVDQFDRGLDAPDAAFQAASAKVVALDAAFRNTRADIQVHGGMGVTAENDSHLYLARAHVMAEIFGNRRQLLEQVITAAPMQSSAGGT